MRPMLKIALLALVATVLAVDVAAAQETPAEVVQEPAGNPCNPCTIHAEGESHLRALPSGVIVSSCHDEYSAQFYSNGTGEVEWTGSTHVAPGCNVANCVTSNEGHWPMANAGELAPGIGHMTVRFCLRGSSVDLHCNAEVLIDGSGGHDGYAFSTTAQCAGGARVVEAWGAIEGVSGLEVVNEEG